MKTLFSFILIFCLGFINYGYSNCLDVATSISKGTPAPCDGVLLGATKEKHLREERQKDKLTLEQLSIKNSMLEIYKQDIKDIEFILSKEREKSELWRKAAEDSTKAYVKSKESNKNRDIIMILLGIGLTIGAGFAVGAASR